MNTIYQKLAAHLNKLSMGYPGSQELLDLLQAMFTLEEAEAAMGISTDLLPLQVEDAATIAKRAGMRGVHGVVPSGCDIHEAPS